MLQGLQELFAAGFLSRLAIDLAFSFALIRGVYHRAYGRSDLFLTLFSLNLVVFLIAFVLNGVELTLGAAFGLFAVFSMLRYRTEVIATTDMTYMFLAMALGLIMAVSDGGPAALVAFGLVVLAFTQVLEAGWFARREVRQTVLYDRIDLVHTANRDELIADLRARTGLKIHRVEVQEMDLLRDSATLAAFYYAREAPVGVAEPRPGPTTEGAVRVDLRDV